MKKKSLIFNSIILLNFVLVFSKVNSQPIADSGAKSKLVTNNYDRSSLTILFGDIADIGRFNSLINSIADTSLAMDKFDDNSLNPPKFVTSVRIPVIENEDLVPLHKIFKERPNGPSFRIAEDIKQSRIPNQIIKNMFMVSDDGLYSMDRIAQRGLYNANNNDATLANASKRGLSELKQSGISLLSNIYIVAIGVRSANTMKEVYDEIDRAALEDSKKNKTQFTPVKRDLNGFQGKARVFVYRLDFNDSLTSVLWNDFYSDNETHPDANVRRERLAKLMSANIPLQKVAVVDVKGSGVQSEPGSSALAALLPQRSQEELMMELMFDFRDAAIKKLEKEVKDFQVKAIIQQTQPISIEIGKKEQLRRSDRYFVYETREKSNGSKRSKKVGVIRAQNVVDNRKNVTDVQGKMPLSTFYQICGSDLGEGMIARQKKDIGVSVGVSFLGKSGLTSRLLLTNYLHVLPVETYLTFDLLGRTKKFEINGSSNEEWKETLIDIDLEKRFMVSNSLFAAACIGYSASTVSDTSYDADALSVSGGGLNIGGSFGCNLTRWFTLSLNLKQRFIKYEADSGVLNDPKSFRKNFGGPKFNFSAYISF